MDAISFPMFPFKMQYRTRTVLLQQGAGLTLPPLCLTVGMSMSAGQSQAPGADNGENFHNHQAQSFSYIRFLMKRRTRA